MPQTEFERENLERAYPFVDANNHVWLFPLLADASVVMRESANFTYGLHRVNLYAIGQLTSSKAAALGEPSHTQFLAMSCQAAPLRGELLLFTFTGDLPRYAEVEGRVVSLLQFMSIVFGGPAGATVAATASPKWEGYVVLGDTSSIPVTPTMLSPIPYLEPARITNSIDVVSRLGRTYVYNQVMTQYTQPSGCDSFAQELDFETGQYVLAAGPITGEFRIAGGHSTRVSQNTRNRVLTLRTDKSGGEAGVVCLPVPPADGLDDTDTSPRCDEVLRSVNGATGPILSLSALESVEIGRFPLQHRVIIAPVGIDSANCPVVSDPQPVEYLPGDEDGAPCGDDGQPVPPPPGLPNRGVGYVTATTTSTTTAQTEGNMCRWAADGSDWYLAWYPCLSPNGCELPPILPTSSGDVSFTPCQYINDSDGTYILNPSFLAASPFNAWDRVGNVLLLTEAEGIPSISLPAARLAPTGSGASLIQRMISIDSNSAYVLFFECRVLQGIAELAVGTENDFASAVRVSLDPQTHGQWTPIGVGPLNYTTGPLRLVVTAGSGTILDISQFALVRQ
jgi:hypothetical protein